MEEQKFQIGDIVKVVCDEQDNDVRIAKVVAVCIYEKDTNKYLYGVSYNINGKKLDKTFLTPSEGYCLAGWIDKKISIS